MTVIKKINSLPTRTLIVVVMVLVGVILGLLTINKQFFEKDSQNVSEKLSVKNKMDAAKQFVDFEEVSKWKVFENDDFGFTFKYPSEVEIENRTVKSQKVVGVNIRDGGRRYTILKFEIRDKKPNDPLKLTTRTGQDSDNNQIIEYTTVLNKTKTLVVIGTVFPAGGSNYKYGDLISSIMNSLVIKTK